MLERLGVPVVRFAPETGLDDVAASLRRMGRALGREAEAEAAVAAFEADRARLAGAVAARARERAALWYASGWTGRRMSLAGDILAAAGLDTIADEVGLSRGGMLALEALILAAPDMLVLGRRWPGHSEAMALLAHPALRSLPAQTRGAPMADRDWVCGTPRVLAAVAALIEARGP
jgi:iron complex transport system substrate-binding protein